MNRLLRRTLVVGLPRSAYNAQANFAGPVSVGSPSAGGAVTQSNAATNTAAAFNLNETFQFVLQEAGISRF